MLTTLNGLKAVVALSLCVMILSDSTANEATVSARWRFQEIRFEHQQEEGGWSCQGYEQVVKRVLRAVGAHPRTRVNTRCAGLFSRNFGVTILTATPTGAHDSPPTAQEKLVMEKMGVLADPPALRAEKKTFDLAGRRGGRLESSQCGLVEELARLVFPALDIELVKPIACRSSAAYGLQRLEVTALLPIAAVKARRTSK